MIIDQKGKLFGKINIVDLLIILFVLVAVGATVYKFQFSAHKDVNTADGQIEYTLKVQGVRDFTANQFAVGDEVFDKETNKSIGTITGIRQEDAEEFVNMADGTFVMQTIPDKFDLYITIVSDARMNDEGYFANGTKQIGAYSTLNVYTQKVEVYAQVQDVGVKE